MKRHNEWTLNIEEYDFLNNAFFNEGWIKNETNYIINKLSKIIKWITKEEIDNITKEVLFIISSETDLEKRISSSKHINLEKDYENPNKDSKYWSFGNWEKFHIFHTLNNQKTIFNPEEIVKWVDKTTLKELNTIIKVILNEKGEIIYCTLSNNNSIINYENRGYYKENKAELISIYVQKRFIILYL